MLHVLLAVMVSLAGAGEGDDAAPAPATEPATTTASTVPSTGPASPSTTPPTTKAPASTALLPALPWLALEEVPVLPHPAFAQQVKEALGAEADREGYEARSAWCIADELATDVGDRSPVAVLARERCTAWTAAVGNHEEEVGLQYLPAVLAHVQSDASDDEKIAVLKHFASMLGPHDTAGAWARGNVSRLRRGGPLKLEINATDPDGDEVAHDTCPYEAEDVDGDKDDDGCLDDSTCCAIEHEDEPWWWKAMKIPATPDMGLGVTGAWSLGGVVDGDRPRASVLAPTLTLALPFVEASLLLPTVVGLGDPALGGGRAGVGGALSLTPVEFDPIFPGESDFRWIAPTIGADVFAGDDDVRFGLIVGNSVTIAGTFVVRPFYRYDLFAPAGTSPHGLGVVVRVNVFHALGEVDW